MEEFQHEKWNRRYTNNFPTPQRKNIPKWEYIFEDVKNYFFSTEIGIKLLSIKRRLTPVTEPSNIDVSTQAKRVYLTRTTSAICWGLLAQLLVTIQFHILVNASFELDNWFFNCFNGFKHMCNAKHLLLTCCGLAFYGFLLSEFYVRRVPLCTTRFDYLLNVGLRKLLLLGAQFIFVFWSLSAFKDQLPEKDFELSAFYIYFTATFVVLYNFWKLYLFQSFEANFELVPAPAYEQLYSTLRPKLWLMLKRNIPPLLKASFVYFVVVSAANFLEGYQKSEGETYSFSLATRNVWATLQFWLILSQSQHTLHTLDSLIRFKLNQNLEFAIKHNTGKTLLLEALQVQEINPWIFELAARDLLALSRNSERCREVYVMTYEQVPYLWRDITELSLEIVRHFTRGISKKFESPDKLLSKEVVQRALHKQTAQHIFRRTHGRDHFVVSLATAPTLCHCPLGPTRPAKPVLKGFLRKLLWYHIDLFYKLLSRCKIVHLWHFFFCRTFGVRIRHQLQNSEPIEAIILAVSNVCVAACKDNELPAIKSTIPDFVKTTMDLIEALELVPFGRYQLYGLNGESFGKLKSLKAHTMHSLFSLLQCYDDKLMLFVENDVLQDVQCFKKLYKWPVKYNSSIGYLRNKKF